MTNLTVLRIREFVNQYKSTPLYLEYKKYMQEHPFAALGVTIIAALSFIPVMTFICFVLITVLLSVLGFMFFQCTILTIGMLMLGGVLFVIVLLTAGATTILAVTWWVAGKFHGLFCSKSILQQCGLVQFKNQTEHHPNGNCDHGDSVSSTKEE